MTNAERGEHPDYGDRPQGGDEPRVVVRDRRRIDPETGEVRPPAPDDEGAGEPGGRHAAADQAEPTVTEAANGDPVRHELQAQLDERTADLQRLTAEYANYRKRVDRDREAVLVAAKASLASELLSVLDDVDRAAAHGDLTGGFKTVAEKLVDTLHRAGLEPFGEAGEEFDPSVHEAVQHDTSPDVPGPTVTAVLRRGYRFGDKVVRAALVAVTDHEPGAAPAGDGPTPQGQDAAPGAGPDDAAGL
jgi:molecular chaperone GrpE